MCGVSGLCLPSQQSGRNSLGDLAGRMAGTLRHRGPDSGGVWTDEEAGIALSHRRLSILDLSPEGHQPMISTGGRYVITFNGEIYNHLQLRTELAAAGCRFRGHSDTEVLLALVEARGIEAALTAAAGMFALAIWDRSERTLYLARDRLGKKPLYVGCVGSMVAFASELKAFAVLPGFDRDIDCTALRLYLRRQYVPAPRTIWRNIRKLPAGSLLRLQCSAPLRAEDLDANIRSIWSPTSASEGPELFTEAAALDALDSVLGLAVRERMVADVPVGAFLSGGIDSSLIVAMMQEQSSKPVRTFTIGFGEKAFDEAAKGRAVACYLGTDHTEVCITAEEAREVIPLLPEVYDEPFADASQIPSWHLARVARSEVTVCLSGDGGDESFGGYGRYMLAAALERRLRLVPRGLRRAAASALRAVPIEGWDSVLQFVRTKLPPGYRGAMTGDRVHKLAGLIAAADGAARYQALLDLGEADVLAGGSGGPGVCWKATELPAGDDYLHRMMLHDTESYLPDDVLTKVDRASMAVSLEVRAPLLDHRVVELAWRLPVSMKLRGREGKWLLRRLLERRLPTALVDQGKAGFGVPIGEWLRGPLRDWAEWLLDEGRIRERGLFDAAAVRALWTAHQSNVRNHATALWAILMFECWFDRWGNERATPVAELRPVVRANG